MKKFVAMMMVVVTLMTMGIIAQAAELHVKTWRGVAVDEGMKYYVTYESDAGAWHEFEVTEAEFYAAVEELAEQKKLEQKEAEKEAKKAEKRSFASVVTFWNPND